MTNTTVKQNYEFSHCNLRNWAVVFNRIFRAFGTAVTMEACWPSDRVMIFRVAHRRYRIEDDKIEEITDEVTAKGNTIKESTKFSQWIGKVLAGFVRDDAGVMRDPREIEAE